MKEKHKPNCSCFNCSLDPNAVKVRKELDCETKQEDVSLSGKEVGYDYCPQCQLSLDIERVYPRLDVKEFIKQNLDDINQLLMYQSSDIKGDGVLYVKYRKLKQFIERFKKRAGGELL